MHTLIHSTDSFINKYLLNADHVLLGEPTANVIETKGQSNRRYCFREGGQKKLLHRNHISNLHAVRKECSVQNRADAKALKGESIPDAFRNSKKARVPEVCEPKWQRSIRTRQQRHHRSQEGLGISLECSVTLLEVLIRRMALSDI